MLTCLKPPPIPCYPQNRADFVSSDKFKNLRFLMGHAQFEGALVVAGPLPPK